MVVRSAELTRRDFMSWLSFVTGQNATSSRVAGVSTASTASVAIRMGTSVVSKVIPGRIGLKCRAGGILLSTSILRNLSKLSNCLFRLSTISSRS